MPVYYYHVIAFLAGFILDCILGDPYFLPHPVRAIGKLISLLETKYLGKKEPAGAEGKTEGESPEETEEAAENVGLEEAGKMIVSESLEKNDVAHEDDWLQAEKLEAKDDAAESEAWESSMKDVLPEEIDWSQPAKKAVPGEAVHATKSSGETEEPKEKSDAATPLTADAKKKREQGRTTVLVILLITVLVTDVCFMGSYYLHPIVGCIVEAILTYQILAAKCLCVESMKVYQALKKGTIEDARKAVAMIVGRDTQNLDEEGVARAAVETVAENTSDGVIAPMLCLAIGGPVLGMVYKAINTMDSMIGYKNERYLDFGRAAAKLDDIVNFLPSRISAWLMIFSCHFLGDRFIASEAKRIYLRDRRKHSSPNSAQTESACAGALGIQLGGDSTYFGKLVHKPLIGDGRRKIDADDIALSNHLMYGTTILCLLICLVALALVCQFAFGGMSVVTFKK